MNTTPPDRIKDLFHQALEIAADRRSAFLEEACQGDTQLHSAVQELLVANDHPHTGLESPLFKFHLANDKTLGIDTPSEPVATSGRQLGRYRLREEIGAGGMGIVWLADRADGLHQRQVAIKLARNWVGEDDRKRFLLEQQTLAELDHPYIAKLLDSGIVESGQPYVVMEYVRGKRVTDYCDDQLCSVRRRLDLFLEVCDAVQFAHQHLIIHRDIKPANILVDDVGHPKLLDFGIAKLLSRESIIPPGLTTTETHIFTPEYASPEQLANKSVTIATDVFSLGVVLFELLTGRKYRARIPAKLPTGPFNPDFERPSKIVLQPLHPTDGAISTGGTRTAHDLAAARDTSPDRLHRLLSGDLDTIITTALRKEPQRRYATVEQFADDIRRHLQHHPITARPDTWSYRTAKFIRRNRALAAALGVGVVGLLATVGGTSVGLVRANLARLDAEEHAKRAAAAQQDAVAQTEKATTSQKEAERQKSLAEAVKDFMVKDLLLAADPQSGLKGNITARELAAIAAEKVDAKFKDDSVTRGEVHETLGHVFSGLGEYEKAIGHLQKAYDSQLAEFGVEHETALSSKSDIATNLAYLGRYDEAEPIHLEVLAIRKRVNGDDNSWTMSTMHNLAFIYQKQGRVRDAERVFRELLPARQRVQGPEDRATLICQANLAVVIASQGRWEEGTQRLTETIDLFQRVIGDEHPWTLNCRSVLGLVYQRQGLYDKAEPISTQVAELQRKVSGETHSTTLRALENLGTLYTRQGRLQEAHDVLSNALEKSRKSAGESHTDTLSIANSLARNHLAAGRLEDTLALTVPTLEQLRKTLSPTHFQTGFTLLTHGQGLTRLNEFADAEKALLEAYNIQTTTFGDDTFWTREVAAALVELYTQWNKPELADRYR